MSGFFFFTWMSNCSSTIWWKDYLCSIILTLLFCQKSVDYLYRSLFLGSSLCSTDFFVYLSPAPHRITGALQWVLQSSSIHLLYLFFCSIVLAVPGPLPRHVSSRISWLISKKIICWEFDWDCVESIDWIRKNCIFIV